MQTDLTLTLPDGRTVGFADYGPASAAAVLWCHGGPGSRLEPRALAEPAAEAGFRLIGYGYDNANRLTSVTDWNSNAIAYAYDDAGRMTTKTLPSGTGVVSAYTYDDADRLTGISHVKGGTTTIASVSYTLDDVGNRTQRVDQAGTHTYEYDDLYRLTSVTYPWPSTTTYAFDAFGNRTSMTAAGNQTTYTYDDADRLTSVDPPGAPPAVSYTWDDNGSLTARGSDSGVSASVTVAPGQSITEGLGCGAQISVAPTGVGVAVGGGAGGIDEKGASGYGEVGGTVAFPPGVSVSAGCYYVGPNLLP